MYCCVWVKFIWLKSLACLLLCHLSNALTSFAGGNYPMAVSAPGPYLA